MSEYSIAIVGNPNCGKTTVFNALTGARPRVGNWPGVTVDRKIGSYRHVEKKIEVADTPGIYSLSAGSVDEEIARDHVLSGEAGLIVNIVDGSNIERNLYLTTQLMEMQPPLLIALIMMDVAEEKGMRIDVEALADRLGCPVIPLVASKNIGITRLKGGIGKAVAAQTRCPMRIMHPVDVQQGISKLLPHVQAAARSRRYAPEWMALKLLEGDEKITAMVDTQTVSEVKHLQGVIEDRLGDDAEMHIATARYAFIHRATPETIRKRGQVADSIMDRLDHLCLSRVLGIPVFLVAMYLMFMFTINIGGAFIDFFDILAGAIFVDGAAALLSAIHAPEWLIAILAGGIGGGLQTMATFIPPIGCMFLALSFLEDSGYLARAAFVMDRFMRLIGLPGKAFIPMLVGFGCNVPAIMAARTLENERDRTLTVMMNPFMSRGARLPVYALFAAAFFPTSGQSLVLLLYLIGIGVAVFTGLVLKKTLLKGELTPFVMELPPYHLPTFKAIVLRACDRLKGFLFKAGKVLIPVIMVLAFFNSMGTDGSFGNEDDENSVLAVVSRTITPVLKPIGVTDDK